MIPPICSLHCAKQSVHLPREKLLIGSKPLLAGKRYQGGGGSIEGNRLKREIVAKSKQRITDLVFLNLTVAKIISMYYIEVFFNLTV